MNKEKKLQLKYDFSKSFTFALLALLITLAIWASQNKNPLVTIALSVTIPFIIVAGCISSRHCAEAIRELNKLYGLEQKPRQK